MSPRKIISPIIDQLTSAGVRFVYFSPRNMRRTKELASQMGIDVGKILFRSITFQHTKFLMCK